MFFLPILMYFAFAQIPVRIVDFHIYCRNSTNNDIPCADENARMCFVLVTPDDSFINLQDTNCVCSLKDIPLYYIMMGFEEDETGEKTWYRRVRREFDSLTCTFNVTVDNICHINGVHHGHSFPRSQIGDNTTEYYPIDHPIFEGERDFREAENLGKRDLLDMIEVTCVCAHHSHHSDTYYAEDECIDLKLKCAFFSQFQNLRGEEIFHLCDLHQKVIFDKIPPNSSLEGWVKEYSIYPGSLVRSKRCTSKFCSSRRPEMRRFGPFYEILSPFIFDKYRKSSVTFRSFSKPFSNGLAFYKPIDLSKYSPRTINVHDSNTSKMCVVVVVVRVLFFVLVSCIIGNMKERILKFLVLQLVLFQLSCVCNDVKSFFSIGGTSGDYIRSVQQTNDGGYIVTGDITYSFGEGDTDVLLAKYYSNGTLEWAKSFGGNDWDYGNSVQQTNDGGYIVTGYTDSFGAGYNDVLLAKYYSNGNLEWAKTLGGNDDEYGYSVQQTNDGGYILTGYTRSFDGPNPDVLLAKYYSNGTLEWAKTLGGNDDDRGRSVQQTNDGYIITGYTDSVGEGYNDVLLAKYYSNGTLEWAKTLGGNGWDYGWSVQQTNDGGYILTGYTSSFGAGIYDVLLAKYYSNGTLEWAKTLGGNDYDRGYSVQQTNDGGYIVTGYTESFGAGYTDVLLAKYYSNGTLEWAKTIGGNDDDEGYSVQQTNDGGYIVTGYTESFGTGFSDAFISKIGSNGESCAFQNCSSLIENDVTFSLTENWWIVSSVDRTGSFSSSTALFTLTENEIGGSYVCVDYYCNRHGSWDSNECECHHNYYGVECEISTCFGVLSNSTTENVCSNHGECVEYDNCSCFVNYTDGERMDCSTWFCFGQMNDFENVCNGFGNCTAHDNCSCLSNYSGYECESWDCFLKNNFLDEETICGGHGECVSHDQCNCSTGYTSYDCSEFTCHNISSELNESCGTHGICVEYDTCSCFGNYTNGERMDCSTWFCYGLQMDDFENVCNGFGNCTSPDNCSCFSNYSGYECESWYCFSKNNVLDEETICGGHGECTSPDQCLCSSTDYTSSDCSVFTCYNISSKTSESCGPFGYCIDIDECQCFTGYYSTSSLPEDVCASYYCSGIHADTSTVCSSRGDCTSPDICECKNGYDGDECETYSCGFEFDLPSTCSGKGECVSPDNCECKFGYSGSLCQTNDLIWIILAPVSSVVGLGVILIFCGLVFCCLCVCICVCVFTLIIVSVLSLILLTTISRLKRFSKLKNLDMLLQEQKADERTDIAHLKINRNLFKIPISEIKVLKILGEGGSSSVVYQATWKNRTVAYKCFKTRHICSDQDSFSEFEREAEIFSSISHPNVVAFFGCTLDIPRVGIVMEYCSNGESLDFVNGYEKKHNKRYPVSERVRMLGEIVSSMDYLHSRKIVHRDLKCENVLIDKAESCKLMDFGLSKISERLSKQCTKKIGTNIFMAPEVAKGSSFYSEKCDVYSFGIMVWILITGNGHPYKGEVYGIEMRVANDPTCRPDVNEMKKCFSGEKREILLELTKLCWSHDPNDRPSFSDLLEKFSLLSAALGESVGGPIRSFIKREGEKEVTEEEKPSLEVEDTRIQAGIWKEEAQRILEEDARIWEEEREIVEGARKIKEEIRKFKSLCFGKGIQSEKTVERFINDCLEDEDSDEKRESSEELSKKEDDSDEESEEEERKSIEEEEL